MGKENFYIRLLEAAFTGERERHPIERINIAAKDWKQLCESAPEGRIDPVRQMSEIKLGHLGLLNIRSREPIPIYLSLVGKSYVHTEIGGEI